MDRRRLFSAALVVGGIWALPIPCALGQARRSTLKLAVLSESSEQAREENWAAFFKRLAELGYAEGKNLAVERRFSAGAPEHVAQVAAELINLRPDVVFVQSTPSAQAAMRATTTVPIVFAEIADPVAAGLVKSLARPGGNVTGVTASFADFGSKWLELLKDLAPRASKFGYLSDIRNKGALLIFDDLRKLAERMHLTIQLFDVGGPSEAARAFANMERERIEGFIVGAAGRALDQREQIVRFAADHKLPAIYAIREYPEAGGLLSYGPDSRSTFLLAAEYVRRVADGVKPADLPVQRQDRVITVLNLKTARAAGINIPPSIRARADVTIE